MMAESLAEEDTFISPTLSTMGILKEFSVVSVVPTSKAEGFLYFWVGAFSKQEQAAWW